MNVTYPPRKPDQNSSQQSAQDGVQCWHVAVVVALLVAILVAILILVPIYTLNNTGGGGTPDVIGHSDLDMDSTFGNDLFTDVDSFDYVEPFENFQMVTNQSLNFTERLALNIINNLIKSGKVEFNSSSKTSLPCNNTCTSKIITCAQRLVVTDAGGGVKSTDLSNRLREGSAIAIRGKLKANTQRFVVDLLISNGKALHLNPRLRYFSDTNVMVVNSFLNNVWGYENRHTTAFPFTAGKFFEIVIRCNTTAFNITSNGLSITFDYRVGVQLKNIVSMQFENMEVIDVMLM
ncbi:galectin-8-like isoform X2 [Syngnathus scovelli]|uniref:galectin-8-like isoform X2 n=1 Tax=Syngnathus scovelli TaxID=161590 RepID=UPI002110DB6F|nr:galectin-8-like isoform X2 [Syngnathus scovelli]